MLNEKEILEVLGMKSFKDKINPENVIKSQTVTKVGKKTLILTIDSTIGLFNRMSAPLNKSDYKRSVALDICERRIHNDIGRCMALLISEFRYRKKQKQPLLDPKRHILNNSKNEIRRIDSRLYLVTTFENGYESVMIIPEAYNHLIDSDDVVFTVLKRNEDVEILRDLLTDYFGCKTPKALPVKTMQVIREAL